MKSLPKITLKFLLLVTTIMFLTSCSNGNTASSNQNNTSQTSKIGGGRINLGLTESQFSDFYSSSTPFTPNTKYSLSGVSDKIYAALGVTDFIPYAQLAYLGLATVYYSYQLYDVINGNTLSNDYNALSSQISQVQSTANTILNETVAENNNISLLIENQYLNSANQNYNTYTKTINTIAGQTETIITQISSSGGIESVLNNPKSLQDISNEYATLQNDIANTSYYTSITNTNMSSLATVSTPESIAYYNSNSYANSTLGLLLNSAESYLATSVPYLGSPSTDLVSNLNSYNQLLISFYETSLASLQEEYMVEAFANAMRYRGYTVPGSTLPVNAIYKPGKNESEDYTNYMSAQQNLTQYFGQMINGLYLSLMEYSISDYALPNQAVTTNYSTIYESIVALSAQAKTMQGDIQVADVGVNQVPSGSWKVTLNLYQNPYLTAYIQCGNLVYNNESITQANCPLLFTTPANGIYTGTTLAASNAQNNTTQINLSICTNNSAPLSELGANAPDINANDGLSATSYGILQCNTYANFNLTTNSSQLISPQMYTNTSNINWGTGSCTAMQDALDGEVYSADCEPIGYSSGLNSFIVNNTHSSFSINTQSTNWGEYSSIINSTSSINLLIANGFGFNQQSGQITNGGGSGTEVSYLQITTPDGTILPVYLGYSYNHNYGGVSLQCPSAFIGWCETSPALANNSPVGNNATYYIGNNSYTITLNNPNSSTMDIQLKYWQQNNNRTNYYNPNTYNGSPEYYQTNFYPGQPNGSVDLLVLENVTNYPSYYENGNGYNYWGVFVTNP